jgi:Cu+-exporting ATPase
MLAAIVSTAPVDRDARAEASLAVGGMTCAACVRRVERALAKVPGVKDASVNLATERARVEFDGAVCDVAKLEAAVESAGYNAKAIAPERAPWPETIASLASGAVMMVAMGLVPAALHHRWMWVELALATLVLPWAGRTTFAQAWHGIRHRETNMHTLVALGAIVSYAVSVVITVSPSLAHALKLGHRAYFESSVFVIGFVLLGKSLEHRARLRASEAIRSLAKLRPDVAHRRERDGTITDVALTQLRADDVFVVRPGERVATDGVIIDGRAAVDESILTGESAQVTRSSGDPLLGGTLVIDGALEVRVTRVGGETTLARIVALVDQALSSKADAQRLADEVASWFVPVVLVIAALTFAAWALLGHDVGRAVSTSIAVLVIACPCALGLATPVAVMVGAGRAAELGILLRNAASLERAITIDTVVFDKTGTLTEGSPEVSSVHVAEGATEAQLVQWAASVEEGSSHPLARAVVSFGQSQGHALLRVTDFAQRAGLGVEGRIEGALVRAGRAAWLREQGVDLSSLSIALDAIEREGRSAVVFSRDERGLGVIALEDRVKPNAREAIALLKDIGCRSVMLTGDRRAVAERVARELGIDEVIADALPEDKAAHVAALKAKGRRVAMVGDGVNDAPALAAADLGIAMGSGADVARAASDLTLLTKDIRAVATGIALARRTARTIRQGLGWAFAYNVVLIPVAAGALVPWFGVALDPALAAAAMSTSSVSVVLNALRLRRFRALTPPVAA